MMPKTKFGMTMDEELLKIIEHLRGREKRSTFLEYLIKLGLTEHHKLHSQKIDVTKEA